MKYKKQNRDKQHEYDQEITEVELFEEIEEILVHPGDIVIPHEAPFDEILEALSCHSEIFMGSYMSPKEIWEEMKGYC